MRLEDQGAPAEFRNGRSVQWGSDARNITDAERVDPEQRTGLDVEAAITDLSARLVTAEPDRVDAEVRHGLARLIDLFHFDRVGLLEYSEDHESVAVTHVAYAPGAKPVPERVDIVKMFPWSNGQSTAGNIINLPSLDALPPDAVTDRGSYEAMGIGAALNVPVRVGEAVRFIVAGVHAEPRDWPSGLVPRLRVHGEIMVNALLRTRADKRLAQAFEEVRTLKDRLAQENVYLQEEVERVRGFEDIVGRSESLKLVLRQIDLVSRTDATVLITGETGTGKELVARAIHRSSDRRQHPLVTVNCAALPATLIESELFGHEKGAFTGASSRRVGRFEVAHGGTIFLDEVGELPPDLQAKLLRVLESGEFQPLGSSKTRHADVRVIAASNRNLEREIQEGTFRPDLYYRLRVFPIEVPPLRQRKEDIPLLASFLVEKKGADLGRSIRRIPPEVLESLVEYDWPGNVRELENVIERAVILSRGPVLTLGDILGTGRNRPRADLAPALPPTQSVEDPTRLSLEAVECAHILRVCEACGWKIKGPGAAADRLGLNPATLYFRMKKLGIARPSRR